MKKFMVGIWNRSWGGWEYWHTEANNKVEARRKVLKIFENSDIVIRYINEEK